MGLKDVCILRYIQNILGGSVKIRSGAKAYRYRLHNKPNIIHLLSHINGNIRHSTRLAQLHRVCQELNMALIYPIRLDSNSLWFAGFFDADGIVDFSIKNAEPQLTIRITNKLMQDIQYYQNVFGGEIYFDSGQNGYYK